MNTLTRTLPHFIYRLHDANGAVVYLGRSHNVAKRLREHYGDFHTQGTNDWFHRVRSLSMAGPFTFAEVRSLEVSEIQRLQPKHNKDHTRTGRNFAAVAQRPAPHYIYPEVAS